MKKEILKIENVRKKYGDNLVLNNVSFTIHQGEIVSLVGENGAGKSTLMNILFGMEVIHKTGGFTGKIYIDGEEANIESPSDALLKGIGMVHQEFMLIDDFSITENVKLNKENTKNSWRTKPFRGKLDLLDRQRMGKETRTVLDAVGMSLDEWMPVAGLSVAHRQFVEIAKVLDHKALKLIIFDEPTAVLTESESNELLRIITDLSHKGVACLFISHKLEEVTKISDRIVVLRDGEVVASYQRGEADEKKLAYVMVGREVSVQSENEKRNSSREKVIMSLRNFEVDMPSEVLNGIDLDIYEGEILGIAGLAGSGKLSISNGIRGLYESRGNVTYQGAPLDVKKTMQTLKRDIGFVSEDRKTVALILNDTIENNCVMTSLVVKNQFLRSILGVRFMDHQAIAEKVDELIRLLQIKCTGRKQRVGALSGGNQQKVCIASVLLQQPRLLFASEPTRGIDIGAKSLILDYLKKLNRDNNTTVVVTSSELHELRSICDRIVVIAEGKIAGIVPANAPLEHFGLLMANMKLSAGNE